MNLNKSNARYAMAQFSPFVGLSWFVCLSLCPAHSHATGIAVYPALIPIQFYANVKSISILLTRFKDNEV